MPDLFSANGNRLKVDMTGDYDPGITEEIDRQIRHMVPVKMATAEKAAMLKRATGSGNFDVLFVENPSGQRVRAYVYPKNREGIHEELSQAVLLKAALGMSGK